MKINAITAYEYVIEVIQLKWVGLFWLLILQTACDIPADAVRPKAPLIHTSASSLQGINVGAEQLLTPLGAVLLSDSIPFYRFETTAEALSIWRLNATERPVLLLLSDRPHLQPVPEELRNQALDLISSAAPVQLALAATDRSPSPLLMPEMVVDAALRSGWFRELVWSFPLNDAAQKQRLELFREQFKAAGIADDREIEALSLTGEVFSGSLRELPFKAAALESVMPLSAPVVIHIDLGYFQPLYKNEISTPLLDVIYKTLATLKSMQMQVLAVTFSYGHRDSQISLGVRFVGDILAYLIEDPTRLDQAVPINWRRQRDALYLDNFFQKEQIRNLFLSQEIDAPNEAWIKFNLYRSAKSLKDDGLAMDYLEQAVALDPIYAIEYLELSALAYNQKSPNDARLLLERAARAFPEDVFIELQLAQLDNETGRADEALSRLDKLRKLPWSTTYYAQVPQYLEQLKAAVKNDTFMPSKQARLSRQQGETSQAADKTSQTAPKRILHSR